MAGRPVTPFNLYRANLAFALQMAGFSLEARQQACEFEMQHIRRDVAAVHGIRNAAAAAPDLSKLAAACQIVARDSLETTANPWQQGLGSAVRLQSRYSEGLHKALATWQSAWTAQWPTHAAVNPVMLPWQEWLQRMQSTAASMSDGPAGSGDAASRVAPANSAHSAASPVPSSYEKRGEHHAG